jgi:hypothetical protein
VTKLLLDSYPAVVCQLCLGCQVADVPSENSWLPEDFSGEVEVIKYFQSLKKYADKSSSLFLQSFNFSTVDTKINLSDLKTRMKYLVNNVIFDRMLKSLHSTFLLVPLQLFNFKYV